MARSKKVIEAEAKAEKRGMEEKRKALAKLLAMEDKLNKSQKERLDNLKKEVGKAEEINQKKREREATEKKLRDMEGISLETAERLAKEEVRRRDLGYEAQNIAKKLETAGQRQVIGAENLTNQMNDFNDVNDGIIGATTDIGSIMLQNIQNSNALNEAQLGIGTAAFQQVDLAGQEKTIAEERIKIMTGQTSLAEDEVDKALEALNVAENRLKVQKDIAKYQGMQNDAVNKLQAPMNDIKDKAMEMGATLKAALANPALILLAGLGLAAKSMFSLFKGAQGLKTELGISDEAAIGLQMQISEVSMAMKAAGIESADVAEAQMALINNFGGVSASSTELLMSMGQLKADFGVSGQAAGALMVTMKAIGAGSEQAAFAMAKNVASLAQAEGVAPGQVMQDIANNTEAFAGFAKDGGMNVARAAIEAKKLGINFDTAVKIADNLLDFESSIQQQMEAEILLGRQLNLDKARQLALSGDIEGLQREVLKNVGSESEFNAMNVLQRRALAQSIGISVTELSKMVANQGNINKQTDTQNTNIAFMAMIMKEVRGLSADLVDIWKMLKPIFMVALAPIGLIVFALVKGLSILAGWITALDDMSGGYLTPILGIATSIYLMTKLTAKEGLMASIKQYKQSLTNYLLEKKTAVMKKVSSGSGSGDGGTRRRRRKNSGLGFVEKLNPAKLLAGAAAMLIVSAALFVTAKALQEFTKVEFSDLVKAGVALLGLTLVLVAIGALMTSGVGAVAILAGAAAMLVIAAALLVLGVAIQAIGSGFSMLSEGISSFTPILTTLVPLASGIFVLAGAFGALGIGMGALAIGALALLPALPVLLALSGIGMLGMALAGGGDSDVAESEPMVVTDMSVTEEKLDGVISAVHALESTNRELLTTMNRGIKGLAEV